MYSSLNPNEFGIEYNTITQLINDDPNAVAFTGGRKWLGVGKTYIRFPSTAEVIEFDNLATCGSSCQGDIITARTVDGLVMTMSIT